MFFKYCIFIVNKLFENLLSTVILTLSSPTFFQKIENNQSDIDEPLYDGASVTVGQSSLFILGFYTWK